MIKYMLALFPLMALLLLTPVKAQSATAQTVQGAQPVASLDSSSDAQDASAVRVRIAFQDQEVVVRMFDNAASRDFLALLPFTAEFSDFAQTEKVATLPRKLKTQGSPTARTTPADFSYYAPWGNLAVFYKGLGSDGQLYVLGRIESGKDALGAMRKNFTARVERM